MSVTLFTRTACPLCDEARDALAGLGIVWDEVDVDGDRALRSKYGERVPVIERDGAIVVEGNLEGVALGRLLGSG